VTGFVSEHPRFGPATPFALLPPDFLGAGSLRRHSPGLQLFDFVQQQPPGDESIKPLLARGLALDLQAGWAVQQHDAGCRFIDILPAMSAGSDKSLFDIGLAHPQGGHALGELLRLFWIHRKRRHRRTLVESVGNLKEAEVCLAVANG
jgi:hypothetical protein